MKFLGWDKFFAVLQIYANKSSICCIHTSHPFPPAELQNILFVLDQARRIPSIQESSNLSSSEGNAKELKHLMFFMILFVMILPLFQIHDLRIWYTYILKCIEGPCGEGEKEEKRERQGERNIKQWLSGRYSIWDRVVITFHNSDCYLLFY